MDYSSGQLVIKFRYENLYYSSKQASVCYLQQHEEGTQQQQDICKKTVILNLKFFRPVVAFFIVIFLKETINVAQI